MTINEILLYLVWIIKFFVEYEEDEWVSVFSIICLNFSIPILNLVKFLKYDLS